MGTHLFIKIVKKDSSDIVRSFVYRFNKTIF